MLGAGSLMCVAGLAAVLLLAHPGEEGTMFVRGPAPVVLALTLAALTVLGLAVSVLAPGALRVLGLAVAAGVLYGVTAGLMKVVAGQARDTLAAPFTHPVLYVVCVTGPLGFLLSQNTFRRGEFLTPALAVITALDPLAGAGLGGLVVIAGIVVLSARAARLTPREVRAAAGCVRGPGVLRFARVRPGLLRRPRTAGRGPLGGARGGVRPQRAPGAVTAAARRPAAARARLDRRNGRLDRRLGRGGHQRGRRHREALACGRPVLMHRPIAAHGRANARLMAEAGLAVVCEADGELAAAVRRMLDTPELGKSMAECAARHLESAGDLGSALRALAAV